MHSLDHSLMIKKLFAVLIFSGTVASAQTLHGTVVDAENNMPLPGVRISFDESDIWTVTDSRGFFSLNYSPGETLIFSKPSFIDSRQSFKNPPSDDIQIRLQLASIRIDEVMLTAKKKAFSEVEIKEEALQKVQSFSLGDVLQQLPGQYIAPRANTEMKNIVFRSANVNSVLSTNDTGSDFGNKAFGTQVLINEIPVSNNENMQFYNSPYADPFAQSSYGFSMLRGNSKLVAPMANYGTDLRQIPTDDIEKIEVVAGIPDAKYGDLTSGLIKVETKTGKRPLQVLTSITDGTYQFGASKGLAFNEGRNALNVSLNYMNSVADPRLSDAIYRRYTGNLLWSTTNRDRNWRNKLSLNVSASKNEGQGGEDEFHGIYINAKTNNFSLSNNSSYRFRENSWIKNLNLNAGVSYGSQNSMRRNFINSQGVPYGGALADSVYFGEYTLPQYFNYNYVDGKPLNIFTDLEAASQIKSGSGWLHNISFGASYRFGDNLGKGRYGSVGQYSTVNTVGDIGNGTRDYNYRDNVEHSTQFALYVQDNIFKKIGANQLKLNAGMRYDLQNKTSNFSPRANGSFSFNNKFVLRAGSGLSTKAPSLSMLYTGPRYLDILLGDYRLPGVYSSAIIQTVVTPGNNVDLKPSKSWKSEVGFDANLSFASLAVTGYKNRLYDGFTSFSKITELSKSKIGITLNGNLPPTFQVVGSEKLRVLQTVQTNGYDSRDSGLEMMVNFKKIQKLNLNVSMKGNYTETRSHQSVESVAKPAVESPTVAYAIFSPYRNTAKLANAGISLDYHVPKAGLIVSVTSEHFLVDSKNTDGDMYPVAYLDQNLARHAVTEADYTNPAIKSLIRKTTSTGYDMGGKTFHNFHLRVTKDFFSGVNISVYLNNMFSLKALNNKNEPYTNFTPISFGGNLSYKF